MTILNDKILEFQKRLQENTRTKEIVQSGYDDLTKTVETKAEQHKETLAVMQTRLTDGKRLSADLSEQVCIICRIGVQWTIVLSIMQVCEASFLGPASNQ